MRLLAGTRPEFAAASVKTVEAIPELGMTGKRSKEKHI